MIFRSMTEKDNIPPLVEEDKPTPPQNALEEYCKRHPEALECIEYDV